MIIGKNEPKSANAVSTAAVSVCVLTKEKPVYDCDSGTMKWTVQLDKSALPMENVILTDKLPKGLTYKEGTLTTDPQIADASASTSASDGRQELKISLDSVTRLTRITFETEVHPEAAGFSGSNNVMVENKIDMTGKADGIEFAEVSHSVRQEFSNHGLVKTGTVDSQKELIQYEVLINPYHLALPEKPALVDTLDPRLQLDTDTLQFYAAEPAGEISGNTRPGYNKQGSGQQLDITSFDPETNSLTVQLPIDKDSRDTYLLTYTADIIQWQQGGYRNSVRFDGGTVMLGGTKNNTASSGGGGGGGGIAARKAALAITKTDQETDAPLCGVSFMLYQWNAATDTRGLPFAQGKTGADGKLSFMVKPGAFYELVETESIPGYSSAFEVTKLPNGAKRTEDGLLIQAGAAAAKLELGLTNKAHTADLEFLMVNESGIPMAEKTVQLFKADPDSAADPVPEIETVVSADGTVKFSGIRRGEIYYILCPGGGKMTIEVPAQTSEPPKVKFPDGTEAELTADYRMTGKTDPDEQWTLTVSKVISGSTAPLEGAEIGLYADAACQALIKKDVSTQDGSITFQGLINGQSYWLKEIAAPDNYNLDSAVYKADAANSTVTIANTPKETPNPDNPGTPEEPVKPEKPEMPEKPAKPEEPETPEQPAKPGEPETPEQPAVPAEPETPEEPAKPEKPGMPAEPPKPGEPAMPWEPPKPGEPAIPAEPAKPGEPAMPAEPAKPGEPAMPAEAVKPEEPEISEEPDAPEEPETPEEPDVPEKPNVSGTSDNSNRSVKPGKSDKTSASAVPGKTGTAAKPAIPKISGTSGAFGGGSDTSLELGTSLESGGSGSSSESGIPAKSGSGDTADFASGSNPPQTGDDTPFLFVITLFSGILSAVMTLCWLLRAKKHEKK